MSRSRSLQHAETEAHHRVEYLLYRLLKADRMHGHFASGTATPAKRGLNYSSLPVMPPYLLHTKRIRSALVLDVVTARSAFLLPVAGVLGILMFASSHVYIFYVCELFGRMG